MRRSHRWMMLASLGPAFVIGFTLMAQDGPPGSPGANSAPPSQPTRFLPSGLTTLYAEDPIARTMNFTNGEYGGVIQDHIVKNRNSDIEFGGYVGNGLTVGIEGGRLGAILDLGRARALGGVYGFEETVGGGQAFASIRFVGDDLHILDDYEKQTTQPLEKAKWLVPRKSDSASIRQGHIYLVRIADRHDEDFELVVKFIVVEYRPDESVTIRWQRLR